MLWQCELVKVLILGERMARGKNTATDMRENSRMTDECKKERKTEREEIKIKWMNEQSSQNVSKRRDLAFDVSDLSPSRVRSASQN
jgi:hypothetical protein